MKVRKIINAAGNVRWQLDLGLVLQGDGRMKRSQTYYRTKDEASSALAAAKERRQAHGDSALALPEADRIRFCAAQAKLATVGGTIEAAVELFLRHSAVMREAVGLGEMLERCLAAKAALGARVRYLQQFRCSCLSFVRGREGQMAHTVTREDVRAWVLGQEWAPKTQRVYLGDLRALFAWALAERLVPENPASGNGGARIELAAMPEGAIERLSAATVRRMMRRIVRRPRPAEEDFRGLLWYFVLATWAGVRPDELKQIDRSALDLTERHVIVEADQAKTRRRRVVDLAPNSAAWLALDSNRTGPVIPPNFRRRWERLRAGLGLMPWPHDVLRHTFASMHYGKWRDESALKSAMGHSAAEDTLMRHYRALVGRREAAEFWEFRPAPRRLQF